MFQQNKGKNSQKFAFLPRNDWNDSRESKGTLLSSNTGGEIDEKQQYCKHNKSNMSYNNK